MRRFLIVTMAAWLSFPVFSQTPKLVKADSIIYPVHQANVGKIVFMSQIIPIESFKEADFLKQVELKEKTDLNIRVFLGNSLTNYLSQLSSAACVDDLVKNGNYQFTFYVDGKKIYVENLTTGAGSTDSKNHRTVFRIPLISSTNEDSWGRFLWNRFLGNGGQEAVTPGEHLLKIEIRPYLKLSELIIGNVLAEGEINIVVPERKINERLVKIQPIKSLTDWSISKDRVDTSKLEELHRKIVSETYKNITSIVVIKEGKLLIEEYFNGANRHTLHDTRSVGKSFASTLLGIAIDDGYIKSESQPLKDFYDFRSFQNFAVEKENTTLADLLTMRSVFDGSDVNPESPGNEEKMYPTQNWVEFTLNLPVDKTKTEAKRWDYFTAGVVVLGDIIQKSTPEGLEQYANAKLFNPLGIKKYKWQHTPQKVANTAGGLQLRSIDYAKYGQLYKSNGVWNGQQLISKDWVAKSLSKQMSLSEEEHYGYLFWNKTYHVNSVDYEVYYASGNGGNKIFIFKDQPFVVVITSTAYNTPYGHAQTDKIITQYIIPAIITKP